MADEPRRSGRATKGQYTKERDIDEPQPPAKKNGRGKGGKNKPAEDEEEEGDNEIIRCVCGTYEEEEDVPRAMICCDNCSAWQHNDCMGLPEDYEVDKYFCEQCRPQNHKDLLAAIKRGERPWEQAAKVREAARAEKAGKKKGGKKGGRKSGTRASEAAPTPSEEPEEPQTATSSAGQKRKAEDSPAPTDPKANKKARGTPIDDTNGARPTSTSGKTSQPATPSRQASRSEPGPAVATDVKELVAARRGAASSLIKLFVEQTKEAIKAGAYSLPTGATVQGLGSRLGLLVEHALYHIQSQGTGDPNDAYKNQLRSISFNVKKNNSLAARLLNEDLTPHGLASMDPKDMASEEQQRKDAAILKEMEKQHTIIEEQGPRIRRTHKGDEYVDESRQVASESLTQNAPVRKPTLPEQEADSRSPDMKSPADFTSRAGRTPSVSIPRPRPSIDPTRKSSTNFDIDKVWSNVQGSPDAEQKFGELPQRQSSNAVAEPVGPGARADADIDALLKDEEVESPPYSPKDYADNEGTVWRGVVDGGNLGRFHVSAKYAAGATPDAPTLRMTWSQLIPPVIGINGRIQPSKADEYLCGLEYSQTSDLVIISMREPENAADLEQFDKFFKYFKSKERFGVGVQHQIPAIKDIYFIPLDAGQELPTFVKKLETDFADPAEERMLLVPIVVKNSELAHNMSGAEGVGEVQSPVVGGPVTQTPITPHEGNYESSLPPNGAVGSYGQPPPQLPGPNGAPFPAGGPQGAPRAPYSTPPPPQPYSGLPAQPPPGQAAAAAQRILGHWANAPAVLQLIAQAPTAGDDEMNVVKECISENPEAANSLDVLTNMLRARWGDS